MKRSCINYIISRTCANSMIPRRKNNSFHTARMSSFSCDPERMKEDRESSSHRVPPFILAFSYSHSPLITSWRCGRFVRDKRIRIGCAVRDLTNYMY